MCAVLEISPKTYYKYRNMEDPDYYDYLGRPKNQIWGCNEWKEGFKNNEKI